MTTLDVLSIIKRGTPDNPVTRKQLASIFGEKQDRQVRDIIRQLIKDGNPIISSESSPAGYYIAENWQQAQEYIANLQKLLLAQASRIHDFRHGCKTRLPPEQGVLAL